MISYKPLWHLLLDKNMKKMDLAKAADLSNSTLARLGSDKYVSLAVIDRICQELDCDIGDVAKIERDKKTHEP